MTDDPGASSEADGAPGPGRAPRPVPLPLPAPARGAVLRRGLAVTRVSTRHFARPAWRRLRGRPLPPRGLARALRLAFETLGGTFLKFGQLVASAPGIFGDEFADELRACLDTGPAVPFPTIRITVEAALGRPLGDVFTDFDEVPIGRASIAVVHRARLRDGRPVAVKVLRPGIEAAVATDLRLMLPLLEFLALRVGLPEAGQLVRMFDGFREQLREEIDLRNEARTMAHFRALLAVVDLPLITVPAPFPDLGGQRVLTMEYVEGVPIDDLGRIATLGVDPRPVMEQLVRGWFITALRDGVFHGDVHAGNLILMPDGRVAVVDWGIVGQLDPRTHRFFRRTIEAALGDETAWGEIATELMANYGPALRAGLGMGEAELAIFSRGVMEPMLTRPFGEASLGQFLAAMQGQVAPAAGRGATPRSWRALVRRLRHQRRMHAGIEAHGGRGTSFDRGTFLLAKQLLYFERYGKMFLRDMSLLGDRAFFAAQLAAGPLGA